MISSLTLQLRILVIHDFNASFLLNVTWIETHTSHHKNHSSYNKTETAKLGNKLSPKKLHHAPMVELYSPTDSSSLSSITPQNNLVITMTDPDAKSSEMCHWIGIGLPVEIDDDEITSMSHKHNFTNGIHDVVSYLAPSPPPKTGKHRYVFLAFRPANGTNEPLHLVKPESRQHWGMGSSGSHGGSKGVRQWAEMNGLIPIGKFFRTLCGV